MSKVIFYCLCFITIYAPIPLGANRLWAQSTIELVIMATFLLHLISVFSGRSTLLPPRYARFVVGALAITSLYLVIQMIPGLGGLLTKPAVATGLSTISLDPSLTQVMLLKTLSFTLFAWLLFQYVDSSKRLTQLALTIIGSALFQAIYGIWLSMNYGHESPLFNLPWQAQAAGSFVSYNHFASFVGLSLAIGIGLLISQLSMKAPTTNFRDKLHELGELVLGNKILLRIALIVMFVALILSRSRGGNSALIIALVLVSIYALFFYRQKPRNMRVLIVSFFILDLLLIGSLFGVEKVKERLVETNLQSETRDEVVRDSIPIILDYPLFGTGGGSFYGIFKVYQPRGYTELFYDHAHNDYIEFSVEIGLPLTLLLGSLVLYSLWASLKAMRLRHTPLFQGVAFGCATAIITLLLHAMVDFPLQSYSIAILFITILCMSHLAANLPAPRKSRSKL